MTPIGGSHGFVIRRVPEEGPTDPPPVDMEVLAFTDVAATYETTTSMQKAMPTVEVGDTVFASVLHRSTLTPPAGWSLLYSQLEADDPPEFDQRLSVYYHTVASGDPTQYIWNQENSARLGVAYLAVRGTGGGIAIGDVNSGGVRTAASELEPHPIPVVNVTIPGSRVIVFASDAYSAAAGGTWTPPQGWTLHESNSVANNRMSVASIGIDQVGSVAGLAFNHLIGDAGVNHNTAEVAVVVEPVGGPTSDDLFLVMQAEGFV